MPDTTLATTVRAIDDRTSIIGVQGSVTADSEDTLMSAFGEASRDEMRNIVLDFTELEYLNSSGIGLIVTLLVRANRQGKRLLAFGLTEHYRHIFELTRLNDAIAIHEAEESALEAVSAE
jgi:anti-sigma B factor antagonist